MYLEHYGLRELPFTLTPDTSYFFGYGHYRDAFNTLMVALQNGEGFIKVTGEVGTGKTLLCRKLLNSLDDHFVTAYIPNPYLTPSALILAVADELDIELPAREGTHRSLKQITRRLIEFAAEGKQVVLCIDEAQAMPEQTLEALRLITNLETEKRKLLQVVLFGQPELDQRLAQNSARQLRQRITFSYTLQPLDADGLSAYLQHRLLVAGGNGGVGFNTAAVKHLYKGSRGFPRLINILAHKSLMLGYGQGIKTIGSQQVKAAIADTEGTASSSPSTANRSSLPYSLAIVAIIAVVAIFAYLYLSASSAASNYLSTSTHPEQQPDTPSAAFVEPAPDKPAAIEPVSTDITPRLSAISPPRIQGGWEPQVLLVHGEALPPDAQLIVSWSGKEKLLPPERVEWLDDKTLRITLTTGVRKEPWQVQLINSDGQRSDAVTFEVLGTTS